MKVYTASYNFPQGFLWGIRPGKNLFSDSEIYAYLFELKKNNIQAVSIQIPWADFEPLKNNYDEKRIDDIRLLLTRIHNQNIEPVIILDIGDVPQWQNLEKQSKKNNFIEDRYNFSVHLINSLVTYANFFVLSLSYKSITSSRQMQIELQTHKEIRDYLHSLSENKFAGTAIPSIASIKRGGGFRNLFERIQMTEIKSIQTDFLAIHADTSSFGEIQSVFGEKRIPLLFFSKDLKGIAPNDKAEKIMDQLYDIWQIYQKGWPLIGLFSEIEMNVSSEEKTLYANSCKNNAFEISTENQNLPDKWVRFLKD